MPHAGGQPRGALAANKVLLFDDCFEHEVLNETDETRIVLLIQVKRPVRLLGRIIGGLFLSGQAIALRAGRGAASRTGRPTLERQP